METEHENCSQNHGGLVHVHGATHGPRLVASLGITGLFVLAEASAGFIAHSLALVSDAGHNATDSLALGLAAYAIAAGKRPPSKSKTFGYHRVAILTALLNASALLAIAAIIAVEGVQFLVHPAAVQGRIVVAVAVVSVLMNTVIAWLLMPGAKESLNMRAAYVHMLGDALSAFAVVVSGVIVASTGWADADGIASLLIAAFIAWSGWGVLVEAVNILLEATPAGFDLDGMIAAIKRLPLVVGVHDVHVWSVGEGFLYMSCHVTLPEQTSLDQCGQVVQQVNRLVESEFSIAHNTVQTEIAGSCADSDDPLCQNSLR